MKGNVIGFDPDANSGAISGHDGERYDFIPADWHSQSRPKHGDLVDFVPEGRRAAQIYLAEPEPVRPSLAEFYLSLNGRISRSQYWLHYVVPVLVVSIVLSAIAGIAAAAGSPGIAVGFNMLYFVFSLLTLWPGIVVLVKRIHDRDKPGWLVLLPAVTAVLLIITAMSGAMAGSSAAGILAGIVAVGLFGIGIWFFVEFGCLRGTIGSNRYGPDPVAAR